ncbi:GNAT family N-acetyltransferase [Tenacibaculum xiamenense]|uniref:GNAT family N-acetyltransferase n=1 Tax=Tenacibaculum xiamenense TaxID=1261553 RepID=UPI00389413BF
MYKIEIVRKKDYAELIKVWEASVRATHDFLKEEDIEYFKPLILNTYFDAVELNCIKNSSNKIIGFSGVAEQSLEMLFVRPDYIGKGVGKTLLQNTITTLNIDKVDVNEQNQQALNFYLNQRFEIINRSELDATGKPYPILHMKLKKTTTK